MAETESAMSEILSSEQLIELIWPAERLLMGMRVCKSLRRALVECSAQVVLQKAPDAHPDSEELAADFRRLKDAAIHILWKAQGRGTSNMLLSAISNVDLRRLELDNCVLGDSGAVMLADVLKRCCSLVHLNVAKNFIGSDGADHLAVACSSLTALAWLDVSDNEMGLGLRRLTTSLEKCTVLTHLNLAGCVEYGFATEEMGRVGESIGRYCALQHLELNRSAIGNEGFERLAPAFTRLTALTHLGLSDIDLVGGGAGVRHLADALRTCTALTRLEVRNNISEHTDSLIPALASCVRLRHLRLASVKLGLSGVHSLAASLQHLSTLTHLDLQNTHAAVFTVLADSLAQCSSLTHLDLSHNKPAGLHCFTGQNPLDLSLARNSITAFLNSCPALEHLQLSDNTPALQEEPAPAPAPYLAALQRSVEQQQQQAAGPGGANTSGNTAAGEDDDDEEPSEPSEPGERAGRRLRHLDVSSNKIDETRAAVWASVLRQSPALTALEVANNALGSLGVQRLARKLSRCPALTRLSMPSTSLGPAGATALADSLTLSPQCLLTHLNLASNRIGPAGISALAACPALAQQTSLSELLLGSNQVSPSGTVALVGWVQRCPKLQVLDVSGNGLGEGGTRSLTALFGSHLSQLTSINLSLNAIGDAGATTVASALGHAPALVTLRLGRNGITDAGLSSLARALPLCPRIEGFDLSWSLRGGGTGASDEWIPGFEMESVRELVGAFDRCPRLRVVDLWQALSNEAGNWLNALQRARFEGQPGPLPAGIEFIF